MAMATESRPKLLSAVAIYAEIEELLPRFRRQQGVDVEVNYDQIGRAHV